MQQFNPEIIRQLYIPPHNSHKGQNGKLMIVGGSHLFHAASLWALEIASRIVDMVFYSSVPENNDIVQKNKEAFRGGIVVKRADLENYMEEAECVLIGPGMVRSESPISNDKFPISHVEDIDKIEDEGIQTRELTRYLLGKYPQKKWVIDAGALQMMDPQWLKPLNGNVVLTPHKLEFERLFGSKATEETVSQKAKDYNAIILVKGEEDIVCSATQCVRISGGNAGMTKGGTGDILAGLIAALACKNDLWISALAGSYINKKAGESLFEKVGYTFNASDLATEIPHVMKKEI